MPAPSVCRAKAIASSSEMSGNSVGCPYEIPSTSVGAGGGVGMTTNVGTSVGDAVGDAVGGSPGCVGVADSVGSGDGVSPKISVPVGDAPVRCSTLADPHPINTSTTTLA